MNELRIEDVRDLNVTEATLPAAEGISRSAWLCRAAGCH